jgi:prepilin-type N-terminal cleavage/methylation domain-containing protein
MNSAAHRGFTAVELLVVLALIAIFLTLALPSFNGAIKRYRVGAAASEIDSALQYARAQAITTRQNVTVGQNNAVLLNRTGCATNGNANDWHCGISVYVDANNNGQLDGAETALKTIPPTDFKAVNVQIVPSDGVAANTTLVYTSMGYVTSSAFCGANGVCSNDSSQFDGWIYVWPQDGATAQNSPYTQTVCATMGGKVRVIPSYVTGATTPACP